MFRVGDRVRLKDEVSDWAISEFARDAENSAEKSKIYTVGATEDSIKAVRIEELDWWYPAIFFEKESEPAIEKYNARLTHILDEEYCNLLDDYEVVQCEFYEDRVEVLWKHYRNDEVKKTTGEDVVEALNKLILHLAKEWEQRIGNKAE